MPTLGRKLHIWAEWTWGMFFRADITHLRFTRSGETEDEAAAPPPPLREIPVRAEPARTPQALGAAGNRG
ncbi:hypothetical protein [Azotobacter chroococcum]|nr:hypothetical protein [Azotobacter chroococcum]